MLTYNQSANYKKSSILVISGLITPGAISNMTQLQAFVGERDWFTIYQVNANTTYTNPTGYMLSYAEINVVWTNLCVGMSGNVSYTQGTIELY